MHARARGCESMCIVFSVDYLLPYCCLLLFDRYFQRDFKLLAPGGGQINFAILVSCEPRGCDLNRVFASSEAGDYKITFAVCRGGLFRSAGIDSDDRRADNHTPEFIGDLSFDCSCYLLPKGDSTQSQHQKDSSK